MIQESHRMLLACLLLAFCSLSYEFMTAQILASMIGQTVLIYSLTMGVYIFALGMGSLVPVADLSPHRLLERAVRIELVLCVLGGLAPFWIVGLEELAHHLAVGDELQSRLTLALCLLLTTGIGLLSGMELPLLLRLDELRYHNRHFMRLMAIDYLASFVGALAFPLWIFPTWGLVRAAALFGLLNLFATLLLVPQLRSRRLRWSTIGIGVLLCLLFWQAERSRQWMSRHISGREASGQA